MFREGAMSFLKGRIHIIIAAVCFLLIGLIYYNQKKDEILVRQAYFSLTETETIQEDSLESDLGIKENVPEIQEEKTDKSTLKTQNKEVEIININTATIEQLITLPGVGETIAKNIIIYRDENGDFEQIEDIKNVKRIGDKVFDKLSDFITVSDS